MSRPAQIKSQLREQLRKRRLQLSAEQRHAAALAATNNAERLLEWQSSRHVAVYLHTNGELETGLLQRSCRAQGKFLYLPVIRQDQSLEFALWAEAAELRPNRYGIDEPGPSAPRVGAEDLDIVFVPLLGWDRAGNRLGMGGGFYDRTLAGVKGPLRVGLAYDCQRLEGILPEPWDVPMDYVVTELTVNDCRGQAATPGGVNPG
jgi:5-formyltetrahydrofolate cyclo-ligase